jgi:diguanylate cyclase (GGDEF)-like protein
MAALENCHPASSSPSRSWFRAQAGSCGTCLHRNTPVICEDVFNDPLWDNHRGVCQEHQIYSTWSTPLISPQDQSMLGAFGLYYQDRHLPAEEEQGLVDHFIHLATLATERHRRDDENSRQAWQDGLTGLGNRHQLQARSADILAKYQAEGRTICLAFIDSDNFRLFNHNYGHHLGDKLLQYLGRKLKDRLAPDELLARFGGDEFVALIEGEPKDIMVRLEQLAAELDAEAMFIEHVRTRMTLSIGLINCADVDFDLNQAIMQADAATRRAKEGGRNRTVLVDANQLDEVQARLVVARKT